MLIWRWALPEKTALRQTYRLIDWLIDAQFTQRSVHYGFITSKSLPTNLIYKTKLFRATIFPTTTNILSTQVYVNFMIEPSWSPHSEIVLTYLIHWMFASRLVGGLFSLVIFACKFNVFYIGIQCKYNKAVLVWVYLQTILYFHLNYCVISMLIFTVFITSFFSKPTMVNWWQPPSFIVPLRASC